MVSCCISISKLNEAIKSNIDYLEPATDVNFDNNLKTELLLTYLNLKKKIIKIKDYKNMITMD